MFLHIFLCALAVLHPGNSLLATNKLGLATWGSYDHREHKGFGTYSYGYNIQDPVTGNVQFKQEERHPNGTVVGSYGFLDANGDPHVTHYVSDVNGYRVIPGKQDIPEVFDTQSTAHENGSPTHQLFHASGNQLQTNYVTAANSQSQTPQRVQNPSPILYQWNGPPPILTYYDPDVQPIPILFRRK